MSAPPRMRRVTNTSLQDVQVQLALSYAALAQAHSRRGMYMMNRTSLHAPNNLRAFRAGIFGYCRHKQHVIMGECHAPSGSGKQANSASGMNVYKQQAEPPIGNEDL